jgi:hypothetical protein
MVLCQTANEKRYMPRVSEVTEEPNPRGNNGTSLPSSYVGQGRRQGRVHFRSLRAIDYEFPFGTIPFQTE